MDLEKVFYKYIKNKTINYLAVWGSCFIFVAIILYQSVGPSIEQFQGMQVLDTHNISSPESYLKFQTLLKNNKLSHEFYIELDPAIDNISLPLTVFTSLGFTLITIFIFKSLWNAYRIDLDKLLFDKLSERDKLDFYSQMKSDFRGFENNKFFITKSFIFDSRRMLIIPFRSIIESNIKALNKRVGYQAIFMYKSSNKKIKHTIFFSRESELYNFYNYYLNTNEFSSTGKFD